MCFLTRWLHEELCTGNGIKIYVKLFGDPNKTALLCTISKLEKCVEPNQREKPNPHKKNVRAKNGMNKGFAKWANK